jgi:hypothetical protein
MKKVQNKGIPPPPRRAEVDRGAQTPGKLLALAAKVYTEGRIFVCLHCRTWFISRLAPKFFLEGKFVDPCDTRY